MNVHVMQVLFYLCVIPVPHEYQNPYVLHMVETFNLLHTTLSNAQYRKEENANLVST